MVEDTPVSAGPSAGEVRALANQLLVWADRLATRPVNYDTLTEEDRHELIIALAEAALETRRLRARLFPELPLAEPLWDVLLTLYVKQANGYRVSLDHLTLESEFPPPRVRQCVAELVNAGLVQLNPDRFDSALAWLTLAEEGEARMADLMLRSAELVNPQAAGLARTKAGDARPAFGAELEARLRRQSGAT